MKKDFTPHGFTCGHRILRHMCRPDRHNELEVNFLEQGNMTYRIGGQTFTIPENRLFVLWAGIPHQLIEFESNSRVYWLTVPFTWFLQWQLPEQFVQRILGGQVITESDPGYFESDLTLFQQWYEDISQNSPGLQNSALLEVEARLGRLAHSWSQERTIPIRKRINGHAKGNRRIKKVEQMATFIAQNYTQPIKVGDISALVNLHPDYAMSIFKKAFGRSLANCLNQHRVSHAQRLLTDTNAKIIDIAFDSGFGSISRFNTVFKSICGITPRQYRSKFRSNLF